MKNNHNKREENKINRDKKNEQQTTVDEKGGNKQKGEGSQERKRESFAESMRRYKSEIVLTTSTTFIMAAIHFQYYGLFNLTRAHRQGWLESRQIFNMVKAFLKVPAPQLVFFLILPVIVILLMKENPWKYGIRMGDWKFGLLSTFVCLVLMAPLLYWASTMEGFKKYYSRQDLSYWWIVLQYGFYMLSWEFLLRGFILFGLEEKMGSLAIWVQSVPFAVAHIGKPLPEALTCYFGGLVLGYIAFKSRSYLYPFLIHWGIYTLLVTFIFAFQ